MRVKIELSRPIDVNGVPMGVIKLRRPKVRDMLSVETQTGSDAEKEIQLFAHLSELTPEQLMDLDMSDYSKLQKAYQDFLS